MIQFNESTVVGSPLSSPPPWPPAPADEANPGHPTRFFSRVAEEKIKAVGGACVLTAQ